LKTEILISCDEWENRVAVLEEGSLAEIYFEREEKVIGSIYKGRVENVLPGMGACFVNIGLGRNAFLYVDDIMRDPINIGETEITDRRKGHTVNELLKVGSDVLVQIVKEPRGLKGARVSTNISLPGRSLVLMPTGRYSGVSSRIEDANERARLKQIMRRVRPEGMATIVRTAAANVSEAELIADLGVQLRLWHGMLESYKRATAPALLHKDLNLVFKSVRDFLTSDVTAVYIDSKEHFEEIRSTMSLLGPQYIDRLKLVDGPGTLFAARGIDEELQKLLKPKIPLPSGGHLVLEHTEALTVIDVNTGKFTGGRNLEDTIVRTNIEAAAEIARQVRLRDIGGIIVVDFIDMTHERSREQVIGTLTESLRRDRTRSTIQVFSNLGLLEFTRKRVGKDLAGQLRSDCPYCTGLGSVMSSETVAIGVLRQIRTKRSNGARGKKFDVVTDPAVATQLLGWYHEELDRLMHDHDLEVRLFAEPQRHREQVLVEEARRLRSAPTAGSVLEVELLQVRLPNPASGVAVINGYLTEVKDAANGSGQTIRVKITGADDNMLRADLAEPLPLGQRRKRRERGHGKGVVGEAPIAPPAPAIARVAASAAGGDEDGAQRGGTAPQPSTQRPRRSQRVAFSLEEEEEDRTPPVRRPIKAALPEQTAARTSGQRPKTEPADRGRSRGGGGRRTPFQGGPRGHQKQPLIVGGDGDIDYESDAEEAALSVEPLEEVVLAPSEASDDAEATRRRRRRRGRGKGRGLEPGAAAAGGEDDAYDAYRQEGEREPVQRRAAPPAPARRTPEPTRREPARRSETGRAIASRRDDALSGGVRPTRPAISPRGGAPINAGRYSRVDRTPSFGRESVDELETVVDPRSGAQAPAAKRYGAVRQLYGKPVMAKPARPADDDFARGGTRQPADAASVRRPRPAQERQPLRGAASPRPSQSQTRQREPVADDYDADELDVVVTPKPAEAAHVEVLPSAGLRRARSDRAKPPERGRESGAVRERPARGTGYGGATLRTDPTSARPSDEGTLQPRQTTQRPRETAAPSDVAHPRAAGPQRGIPRPPRTDEHAASPSGLETSRPPDGGERRPPPRRDSRERGRPAPARREGPAVKQLYPPPNDGVETGSEQPAGKRAKAASRGALMRPADAPPVPKGKVRQLYPPPDVTAAPAAKPAEADTAVLSSLEDMDEDAGGISLGTGASDSSLFVSDAAELEERKARARERAQERRRQQGQDEPGAGESSSPNSESAPESSQESGDWPAF